MQRVSHYEKRYIRTRSINMSLEILKYPHPVLKEVAEEVKKEEINDQDKNAKHNN